MSINWTIDGAKRRVCVTLTQPSNRDQGRVAAAQITSHPDFAADFGVVVEAVNSANAKFVRDVLYFLTTHEEKFAHSRVAVVVSLRATAGGRPVLAEVLAEFAPLPMPIRIVNTYREAERWLSQGQQGLTRQRSGSDNVSPACPVRGPIYSLAPPAA